MFPRLLSCCVFGPTPEVDDEVTVDSDGDGRADLVAVVEVCFERLFHTFEFACARAIDGDSRIVVHEPPDDVAFRQCGTVSS